MLLHQYRFLPDMIQLTKLKSPNDIHGDQRASRLIGDL